jgi:ADP-heptose:LPS heptosyltransferase
MNINNNLKVRFDYNSIGDTLGISAVAEKYYDVAKKPLEVFVELKELFFNNPHVNVHDIFNAPSDSIVLNPCVLYECNIVHNFANQLGLSTENLKPKLYLTNSEIEYATKKLSKYNHKKYKIVICLDAAADCRSMRYEIVAPMLSKLKNEIDCSIFLVGKVNVPMRDRYRVFDEQFYKTTLRECFALMSKCDLYVGVDTGLSHAAAALNIPQVVFYRNCGCHFNAYEDTYYLNSKITCSGDCLLPACHMCYEDNRCMDNMPIDDYFNLICNVLKSYDSNKL